MSIYMSQQKKEELEKEISTIKKSIEISESLGDKIRAGIETHELKIYEKILSKSIVLPVEESWKLTVVAVPEFQKQSLKRLYPNGVIIKP